MSREYINTEGLEQEIQVFESARANIKEIFNQERKNLLKLNNGHMWVGQTQEKMFEMQTRFQNNFEPIDEALEIFINFMKKIVDDYKRFENTRINNLEDNSDNLKVNE